VISAEVPCALSAIASVQAHNHPGGLRAFDEVLLVSGGTGARLGTAGTLVTAKITCLFDEK